MSWVNWSELSGGDGRKVPRLDRQELRWRGLDLGGMACTERSMRVCKKGGSELIGEIMGEVGGRGVADLIIVYGVIFY